MKKKIFIAFLMKHFGFLVCISMLFCFTACGDEEELGEELKKKLLCDWEINDYDTNGNRNTIFLDFSADTITLSFTCSYLNIYDDVWDECEYEIIDADTFTAKKNEEWKEFHVTFPSSEKMTIEPAFTSNKSKETLRKVN